MLFRSKTAIQIEIVKTIFENSKHSKVSKTIFKLKIIAFPYCWEANKQISAISWDSASFLSNESSYINASKRP